MAKLAEKCDPMPSPLIYIFTLRYCLSPSSPSPVRSIKLNPTVVECNNEGSARLLLGVRTPPSTPLHSCGVLAVAGAICKHSFLETLFRRIIAHSALLTRTCIYSGAVEQKKNKLPGVRGQSDVPKTILFSFAEVWKHAEREHGCWYFGMVKYAWTWNGLQMTMVRSKHFWPVKLYYYFKLFLLATTSLKWTVKIWNTIPQK